MVEQAISAHEFERLLAPFVKTSERIAVAVSGGPDSMALTFLVKQLKTSEGLLALIVEHGLRDESAQEAAEVATRLRAMEIETEILPWRHDGVKSRVHVKAREARYGLLIDACKRHGITTLALAHHAGDQAETILMRFAKGSGIDGLAGMSAVTEVDGVRLVRPLLGKPKARLIATCEAHHIVYVTDPSNEADKYARGRLRRVLP
ncbi:MAG: tRNA lysidine(34) synthetase TilS, partial [Alphaproteobacteria bacterium]|nr:tRNA lysidine(34) synthetase TilS [Alphaproteobacteria bacterium]